MDVEQSDQQSRQFIIISVTLKLVAIAGLADNKGIAGYCNTHSPL